MSKAARLGSGSSFQNARPVSARRQAIEAATAAPTDGAADPTRLPLEQISLNPDNPRSDLGDLTDLSRSLRDHGQKTAVSIMSRFAYLEANPGRENDLEPGTRYVVIDGNSRLAAAREAGLQDIRVMLDDGLGADSDSILESALVANIHRQDLDHLDEARALQKLLKIHGTQRDLAARLHRSQGWVAQRLALLNLTPELRRKLEEGTESVDLLRRVGNQAPEKQQAQLDELKRRKEEERATRAAARTTKKAAAPSVPAPEPLRPTTGGNGDYGVITSGASAALGPGGVPDPRAANGASSADTPLREEAQPPTAPERPARGALLGAGLIALPDAERSLLLHEYVHHAGSVEAVVADLSRGLPEDKVLHLGMILRDVANEMLHRADAPS
ncbi:plasmid partitioning protein [Streptomyces omiyaensis]|uniref:ParB/RepB/Spo0J family partition protein n=1 Tax=Streptomyces omiyaensis TaxID=68247 RepID=UPI00167B96AE|nr:ParB/RepB/Spo0J family partition protein [Streptomyces omiyaensis]GGY73270.1 plasmid partitioning protein [Streptomyces omiyaensis]